jgi:hypothetical protein
MHYCGFTPRYEVDSQGNPIPYDGGRTDDPVPYNPPSPESPPETRTPSTLCPAGYTYNSSTGLCTTGTQSGTPPTLDSPGGSPNPGTGSCPLGFVQQPNGTCTATATSCPAGYVLSGGQCVSLGGYNPTTGTPNGTAGTGGATCGGPGQPSCSVTLTAPENLIEIDGAAPTVDSVHNFTDLLQEHKSTIEGWEQSDPSRSYLNQFATLLDTWFEPIPAGGCSPLSANFLGKTWTLNHCVVAEQVRAILGYALWLYFAASIFVMLTGGRKE